MRTSLLPKLALVGLCTALSLLTAEGVLRLLPPDALSPGSGNADFPWVLRDPFLGWRNEARFRHEDFQIDSTGFRGPEVARGRRRIGRRSLRIACIGDSRTFGIWLDEGRFRYDNDYPSRLERLVRTREGNPSAEVINAGVIGYTSSHGLRQYVTEILPLEPDVVVVGFGFNDHSLAYDPARRAEEPHSPGARRLQYALSRSRVYRLLETAYLSVGFLHPKPFSVPWVTPERYAEDVRRFGEVSREHGIRLLLLAQGLRPLERGPSRPAFPGAEDMPYGLLGVKDLAGLHRLHAQYLDIQRETAVEQGIPLLDVAAAFDAAPEAFGDYDLVHFTTAGADLLAAEVYARLRSLGWLGSEDAHTGG